MDCSWVHLQVRVGADRLHVGTAAGAMLQASLWKYLSALKSQINLGFVCIYFPFWFLLQFKSLLPRTQALVFRCKEAWLLEKACPYKIAGTVSQLKLAAYSLALCHPDQQQGGVTGILLIFWQGSASWNLINKSIVSNRNNCKDVVCGSTSYHCCGNATRHVIRLGNCCSNTKIYSVSPTEGVDVGDIHRHTELAKGRSKVSEQGQH